MRLLESGRHDELDALIASDVRVARHLVGRLWDPDPQLRRRAAVALGSVARVHPARALEIARGLLWALRDEAAMHGRYAVPGLAEMVAADPALLAAFVGPLASMLWDTGMQRDILEGLGRIAEKAPDAVADHLDQVLRHHDSFGPEERRLADVLLGRIRGDHDVN